MNRKSILLIGNYFQNKDGFRYLGDELAEKLIHQGWSVLITSRTQSKLLRLLDMLWTIAFKREQYQAAQIDVFSGPAFTWAEASAWLLYILGRPFVLTLHGGNLPEFAQTHPNRVRRVLSFASKVVTPSKYLCESFISIQPDIQVIPNPIELERYSFRQRNKAEPKLIWLRAFHEIYNPSLAPRILAELVAKYPNIHLIMVGPDKGDGSLQRMLSAAETLGVKKRIMITGPVPRDQVPDWLAKGDIFINTTNIDNTPISVIEAMACGLCIVSTNVGGLPYLLEDGVDALLVPPDDPKAMADSVDRILAEPKLAASLSENARKKAEGFSWSRILPVWEDLFQNLTNKAQ